MWKLWFSSFHWGESTWCCKEDVHLQFFICFSEMTRTHQPSLRSCSLAAWTPHDSDQARAECDLCYRLSHLYTGLLLPTIHKAPTDLSSAQPRALCKRSQCPPLPAYMKQWYKAILVRRDWLRNWGLAICLTFLSLGRLGCFFIAFEGCGAANFCAKRIAVVYSKIVDPLSSENEVICRKIGAMIFKFMCGKKAFWEEHVTCANEICWSIWCQSSSCKLFLIVQICISCPS